MDFFAFLLGRASGKANVILDGTEYTFADDGEGNITITEAA